MDLIISINSVQHFQQEYGVPGVIFTRLLGENCSWSNARAVDLKSQWEVIIREHQNQGQNDQSPELHEGVPGASPR
jgi:hypothetical protein